MDSRKLSNSELVDSVRNMAISRRGGVKTRGGRLPPITMRNITQATSTKKVIAPKIPQRRVVVKKEVTESAKPVPLIKKEAKEDIRDSRGRGRGSKVILQTEGTFLAQGPAAKIKREPDDYERISLPRYSAKAAAAQGKSDIKVDPETVKDLLKSSDNEEDYEDDLGAIVPCRFPPLKKSVPKIKEEPLDEDDLKPKIKIEPEDKWNALEGRYFSKLEMDMKTEAKNAIDEFCNVKGKGKLILLQIPDCLPFETDPPADASKDESKENVSASKPPLPLFERLPEGYIGKLQILKSGRRRLMIGSNAFELIDGIATDAVKEVVSVRMHDDGGDITVLGKVEKKMMLTPIIGDIIETATLNKEENNFSD